MAALGRLATQRRRSSVAQLGGGEGLAEALQGGLAGGDARGADLPSRLAAQQMAALAGMSLKVQEALLHSQRMFRQRVERRERGLLRAAFAAWLQRRDEARAKQRRMVRAVGRMRRRRLIRTFSAWRLRVAEPDRRSRLLKQARAALARRLVQRVLERWGGVVEARCAAAHLAMRDHEICALNKEIRKWEAGAVHAAAQRRLRRQLHAWAAWGLRRAHKRRQAQLAAQRWRQTVCRSTVRTWCQQAGAQRLKRASAAAAAATLQRRRLRRVLQGWAARPGLAAAKHHRACMAEAALARGSRRRTLLLACAGWRWFTERQRQRRLAVSRPLARAWRGWTAAAAHCKHVQAALQTCQQRNTRRLLVEVFDDWADAATEAAAARATAEAMQLRRQLLAAQAEAARLAADNARYARLIDNPEWDPQAQAAERAAHSREMAELRADRDAAAVREAEAAAGEAAAAKATADSNFRLLPPRRRTTAEAAARSASALARLSASRRGTQQEEGSQGAAVTAHTASTRPASPATSSPPSTARAQRRPLSSRINNGLLPHNRGLPKPPLTPQGLEGFDPELPGGRHWRPPSPTGSSPQLGRRPLLARSPADLRNRLLVQGGSNFNALVKALRRHADAEEQQQTLSPKLNPGSPPAHRKGATSPKKFDKLSMDMVEVHPDGSLRVEALAMRRHAHANRFTTKAAASHVAFGVTSPAQPASPQRRPAAGRVAAASTNAAAAAAGTAAASLPCTRPGSPARRQPEADGEYDVTVTSSPVGPQAMQQEAAAAAVTAAGAVS